MDEEKREEGKRKQDFFTKVRKNPWILSSLVLGLIIIIMLILNFTGIGGAISGNTAGENLVSYLNSITGGGVEYISYEDLGSIYLVLVKYQEKEIPVYITKDGQYFVQSVVPLTATTQDTQQQPQQNIPKSDKPVVELFVMSYCPYGTQAEKGILPAVSLLGNKIDFKLRFVHYLMHGEQEDLENKRELCIREQEGQVVLNKYLVCILDSDDPYSPKDPAACEKEAGINNAKLQTCLNTKADDYFASDSALSQGYGVQGSPTLIINGVQSSAGRSPQSYLQGICDAFNTKPSECSQTLSTASPSAGFGYNEGTDTVAQC